MTTVVYDAGVLVAAERNDRVEWRKHRARLELGVVAVAPAVVVAQVSRSPRQAQLRRLLQGCEVTELTEGDAHRVGNLIGRAGTSDIVDGAVVAEAIRHSAPIVTGDRKDIARLLAAAGADLPIVDV